MEANKQNIVAETCKAVAAIAQHVKINYDGNNHTRSVNLLASRLGGRNGCPWQTGCTRVLDDDAAVNSVADSLSADKLNQLSSPQAFDGGKQGMDCWRVPAAGSSCVQQ